MCRMRRAYRLSSSCRFSSLTTLTRLNASRSYSGSSTISPLAAMGFDTLLGLSPIFPHPNRGERFNIHL